MKFFMMEVRFQQNWTNRGSREDEVKKKSQFRVNQKVSGIPNT